VDTVARIVREGARLIVVSGVAAIVVGGFTM
jgi:hypothetical protein